MPCLETAHVMVESFHQHLPSCQTHSNWLVGQLSNIICKAKKRGSNLLNEKMLWSAYHQLNISRSFQQIWQRFLSAEKLPNEPLLYQYITDQSL